MNRQQSQPMPPQRTASKPLLRSLTTTGELMKPGSISGSLMGFDKRNPNQKPLSVALTTSPKAGTVSKPYGILRGGISPPRGSVSPESPTLRELGGEGFSVIRTVPGVSALLSSPPRERHDHLGRFLDGDRDRDRVDDGEGRGENGGADDIDIDAMSLASNRQQFGGVPSRLSGGGSTHSMGSAPSRGAGGISDELVSQAASPRDAGAGKSGSTGDDGGDGDMGSGPGHEMMDDSKPCTAVQRASGDAGDDDAMAMVDPTAMADDVGEKGPEDSDGGEGGGEGGEGGEGAEGGEGGESGARTVEEKRRVTIVDSDGATVLSHSGASVQSVQSGVSGLGGPLAAPNSLISVYSQSVTGSQWVNPNYLGGTGVGGGTGGAPSMHDMTSEVMRLQFALDLGQRRGRPLRHVAGSQFRNHVQATLQCDHCVTVDNNLRIAKDNLRSAKLLLARANEEIAALRRAKNLDAATNLITVRDELLANQAVLLKRCDDFEVEVAQSKKKQGSDSALIEYLRKQVADLQEASRARQEDAWKDHEITRLKDVIEDMRRQKETLAGEKEELLLVVQKLQEGVNSYKTQLQQSETRRKTESRRSFENTNQVSVTGDELLRVREELYAKVTECSELVLRTAKLTSEVGTLGSVVTELQSSKRALLDDKSDLQQKVRFATKDAEYARKKAEESERLVQETEGRMGELEASSVSLSEDNARLEREAAAWREEQAKLRASNTSLMTRLAKESEIVRQTLESAISSSVRLCVVAPTVNVHLADSKIKMQSALPENSIRDFVVNEVLAKYTFLFKQENETAGPQDGSPESGDLQGWVQKMLYLMQDSIEQHVEAAMNDS